MDCRWVSEADSCCNALMMAPHPDIMMLMLVLEERF